MAGNSVDVDISGAVAKLQNVGRQMPYVMARSLTELAKIGQAAGERQVTDAFDRPTPFTQKSVMIEPATKDRLVAAVGIRPVAAGYLARQEVGGVKRPEPGAPVLIPVNITVNAYGNIGKGRTKAVVARKTTFVSDQKHWRTEHLPPGIYQRFPQPKRPKRKGAARQKARPPLLLISMKSAAHYEPIFGFKGAVHKAISYQVDAVFDRNLARALATAR